MEGHWLRELRRERDARVLQRFGIFLDLALATAVVEYAWWPWPTSWVAGLVGIGAGLAVFGSLEWLRRRMARQVSPAGAPKTRA